MKIILSMVAVSILVIVSYFTGVYYTEKSFFESQAINQINYVSQNCMPRNKFLNFVKENNLQLLFVGGNESQEIKELYSTESGAYLLIESSKVSNGFISCRADQGKIISIN